MSLIAPDLRRCWLFGPGADPAAHEALLATAAEVLIVDLEDFTPAPLRPRARAGLAALLERCRLAGKLGAVRINALDADGPTDLAAAMAAGADIIAYPMAERAGDIHALDLAITHWESAAGRVPGTTEILPVCETAQGVLEVRAMAAASRRVRAALLGAEDLAADLCAERSPEALELEQARRHFLLLCRAAGIEPVDAPHTFGDVEGARRETVHARRLGYRCKSLVRPEHVQAVRDVLTPTADEVLRAGAMVEAFEAARAQGLDRALVDGLWVEVPTWRHALRLLERARRLQGQDSAP
ncbi:MAG: CoA ester lyase [Burkholderiales bacterium]|nr:MAG: CoA ester lyase [Burkholderiales bacterium]